MASQTVSFSLDRLTQILEEHVRIVEEINRLVNEIMSLPQSEGEEFVGELDELVASLSSVRDGLLSAASEYGRLAACCNVRSPHVEALLSYYVLAGSKREDEALLRASRLSEEAREEAARTREIVDGIRDVLVSVSALGGQASHGSSSR